MFGETQQADNTAGSLALPHLKAAGNGPEKRNTDRRSPITKLSTHVLSVTDQHELPAISLNHLTVDMISIATCDV